MSRVSSVCVLRNLFNCEKRCDSLEARKALLEEFTSKVYKAEVVYVGSDGNIAEKEQYNISFILPRKQKDSQMNIIHGAAIIQKEEDTPINLTWVGKYLANGYKIRAVGENIEKEFNLNCGGNDKINFLFKKTVPDDLTVSRSKGGEYGFAVGSMEGGESKCVDCQNQYNFCTTQVNPPPASICSDSFKTCLKRNNLSEDTCQESSILGGGGLL